MGDYKTRSQLKIDREQVKQELVQGAFFAANSSRHQKTMVKRLFDKEFPLIARFLRSVKAYLPKEDDPKETKERPYRILAQQAQAAEVEFLIHGVCARIYRERRDCWLTTIHDALLFLPQSGDYVKSVMLEEFAKLGLKPTLSVEE
jgi:hypothetical protein